MTDTERETLCTRIDELCAENERLRLGTAEICKQRDFFYQQDNENGERAQRAINVMNAENDKLRELCADIYKHFRGVVFECWAYSSEDFRMYEQRMRELGIEVTA